MDRMTAAYDDFAGAYTDENETSLMNAYYERPATLALVGDAAGRRILDAGCGSGPLFAALREKGAVVTGFDQSAAMVEHARRRLGEDADLRVADLAEPLPFADAEFDDVVASLVLHYLRDWAPTLAEFRRVLKPGGRLVVCAWLSREQPNRLEVRHLLEPICREGRLPGMGTREDYEALAAGAGLTLRGFDDLSRQVRRTWSICLRRTLGKLVTDRAFRRLALARTTQNRSFLLSLPRLMIALRTGAMRYGIFVWEKP